MFRPVYITFLKMLTTLVSLVLFYLSDIYIKFCILSYLLTTIGKCIDYKKQIKLKTDIEEFKIESITQNQISNVRRQSW